MRQFIDCPPKAGQWLTNGEQLKPVIATVRWIMSCCRASLPRTSFASRAQRLSTVDFLPPRFCFLAPVRVNHLRFAGQGFYGYLVALNLCGRLWTQASTKWDSVGIVLYERETIEANSERSTFLRNGQQRPKIVLIFASQSRNASDDRPIEYAAGKMAINQLAINWYRRVFIFVPVAWNIRCAYRESNCFLSLMT